MNRPAILLVLMVIACFHAFAADTVRERYAFVGEKTCGVNGQIQFGLTQYKGNVNVKDIKGIGMRLNDTNIYKRVDGRWYDEKFKPTQVFRSAEKTIFLSNESLFRKKGEYTVVLANRNISENSLLQINYYTGKNIVDDEKGLYFTTVCPGYQYSCEPINLQVSCSNNGSVNSVEISGLSSQVHVIEDLDYTFHFGLTRQNKSLLKQASVKRESNSSYIIRLNHSTRQLTAVLAVVKGCNANIYSTRSYKTCEVINNPEPLTNDSSIAPPNLTSTKTVEIVELIPAAPQPETQQTEEVTEPNPTKQGVLARIWKWIKGIIS
ncbi:MAG: hypothetical protein ABIF10_03955 [Candidatus Woesearchaeota archaeon]